MVLDTPALATGNAGARRLLKDRFRCPDDVAEFDVAGSLSAKSGYFRFGANAICFGRYASGSPADHATEALRDALEDARVDAAGVHLPFDPVEVIDNLLCERYQDTSETKTIRANSAVRALYYLVRPLLGASERAHLQKLYFRSWERIPFPQWPVDRTVENIFEQLAILSIHAHGAAELPFIWFWPEGARSCTIMTHDVESSAGWRFCPQLMELDSLFGIQSSFQIIPEGKYKISFSVLDDIRSKGFEVNIHDLNHDGRLFSNRERFLRRAERINKYARQFNASGFRTGALYRNADWYDALDFSYDMSVPNVAHLDPQRGGCCTVLPFFIGKILELPLTTTQDYSLLHILNDYSIHLWKEQIALILEKHGLISMDVHPDCIVEPPACRVYTELLEYLAHLRSQGQTWTALPGEAAEWWRLRSRMKLMDVGGRWRIEGEGHERARLAYATVVDGTLTYELAPVC